ncbi:MAG: hypothetical protein R6U63_09465 [Longimicrobiales bacterium]
MSVVRKLATSDNSIWTSTVSGGKIEEWSPLGRPRQRLSLQDEDLLREAPMRLDLTQQTPPALVSDIHWTEDGLLWVFVTAPASGFRPSPEVRRSQPEQIYDGLVYVVDPIEHVVITRARFDAIVRPLSEGWAYHLYSTPDGDRRIVLGQLRFRAQP